MWFVLKIKQIPQYLEPCASFLTYWSKSSNFCRWPVKIAYFRKHKKDYGILSFWFRHILAKRKVLRYLFAFIVCHCNVVVDSTFWNTFFPTYRACVLKHARIMNALNMIACRNSARKPLLTYFTRILVFFWIKRVLRLNNKLKQILRLWEIQGRSYNRKKCQEIGLVVCIALLNWLPWLALVDMMIHIISCRKCLITISTEIGNWPREMNIFYVLSQVALVPACFPT